jgi:hypothetical protein
MKSYTRLLVAILVSSVVAAYSAAQTSESWARFKEHTAWIYLGLWDEGSAHWRTLLSHESVGAVTPGGSIPARGDIIRITHPQMLYILDYQNRGESRNRESPAGKLLTSADETGVGLEQGALVEILEIGTARNSGELRSVWARVRPSAKQ